MFLYIEMGFNVKASLLTVAPALRVPGDLH